MIVAPRTNNVVNLLLFVDCLAQRAQTSKRADIVFGGLVMAADTPSPSPGYLRARADALREVLNHATDQSYVGELRAVIDDLETRAAQIEDRGEDDRDFDL